MRAPRLFLDQALASGIEIQITQDRAHYLRNVMRLRPGDQVRLFNSENGEWMANLVNIERRDVLLKITGQTRRPEPELGPELFFAPLKRNRQEFVIEKSVELGVMRLQPVTTAHTVIERINIQRFRSRVIEAAEQCERLTLPQIDDMTNLNGLPTDKTILMADEHGGGLPLLQAFDNYPDAGLLVGPEGGFSTDERDELRSRHNIQTVTLGSTILRAETASIFMLSVWRAWSDDEVSED